MVTDMALILLRNSLCKASTHKAHISNIIKFFSHKGIIILHKGSILHKDII